MENRENAPLRGASQINQEIAAAYQIHPGKGRSVDQVMLGKDTHLAQRRLDLVTQAVAGEEASQSLRGNILGDVFWIIALPRLADCRFTNIRGKHLNFNAVLAQLDPLH